MTKSQIEVEYALNLISREEYVELMLKHGHVSKEDAEWAKNLINYDNRKRNEAEIHQSYRSGQISATEYAEELHQHGHISDKEHEKLLNIIAVNQMKVMNENQVNEAGEYDEGSN